MSTAPTISGNESTHVRLETDTSIESLEELIPQKVEDWLAEDRQKAIPRVAKDEDLSAQIERNLKKMSTTHDLRLEDSRKGLSRLEDDSVQLVVTSPPYWSLKEYDGANQAQLGDIEEYDRFLDELDEVWAEVYRVLEPGGRLCIVVGDVCMSRRSFGRHVVFPLHASIQEHCREIGFDNLAPIIWYKIANAQFEAGGSGFLGKPYEPNAVIKNDVEYILFQRIPNGYRKPTVPQRVLSAIPQEKHSEWFQQVWTGVSGASTADHPAPFPPTVAERLIRMFSFAGDTVLDPFMGSGTTNLAAARWGRNSIGFEIEEKYFTHTHDRLEEGLQAQVKLL